MRAALVWAAVLALAVTLLRLCGELAGWDAAVFDRRPGGGRSWLGITWLVIPVGFWLGRLLAKAGQRPSSVPRSAAVHLGGISLLIALFVGAFAVTSSWPLRSVLVNGGAVLCGLLALWSWPRGFAVLFAYGLLSRLPVVVVQFVAIARGWDTHFAKGPPGSDPADAWWMLTLAQLVLWPFAYTTLVGGFCAVIGALTVRRAVGS